MMHFRQMVQCAIYFIVVPIGGWFLLVAAGGFLGIFVSVMAELPPVEGAYHVGTMFALWGQFFFAIVSGIWLGEMVTSSTGWRFSRIVPLLAVGSIGVYYAFASQIWYAAGRLSPSPVSADLLSRALDDMSFGLNPWHLLAAGAGLHFIVGCLASWIARHST